MLFSKTLLTTYVLFPKTESGSFAHVVIPVARNGVEPWSAEIPILRLSKVQFVYVAKVPPYLLNTAIPPDITVKRTFVAETVPLVLKTRPPSTFGPRLRVIFNIVSEFPCPT